MIVGSDDGYEKAIHSYQHMACGRNPGQDSRQVAVTRDIGFSADDGYERAIHSYLQAGGRNPGQDWRQVAITRDFAGGRNPG